MVAELEREQELWANRITAIEDRHAFQDAERVDLDSKLDDLRAKLRERDAHVEKLKRRESERSRAGGAAARDYEALLDEKAAIEDRLAKMEEACFARAEKVKDAQVELFIEKKRSHEQVQLYKELREKKKEAEEAAAKELRHWQRALLRAHEAHLSAAEGMRARLHELRSHSLEEQLSKCLYWANGLEAAPIEGEMGFEDEEETKQQAKSKLNVAAKLVKGNVNSTNNFFKAMGIPKASTT